VYSIPDGTLLAGELPPNKHKLVVAWIEIHHEDLLADWNLSVNGNKPYRRKVEKSMSTNQIIKLKYREEFRSVHSEAFQHWFEKLAVALHDEDCFLAVRVTNGDGGLDGLVLKEGRVYQVYAPPSLATDSKVAAKVKSDFNKAKKTLDSSLKLWTFVHNSNDGKLGHLSTKALAKLNDENQEIVVEAIGIDGLWERLEKLSSDKLADLFGVPTPNNQAKSKIRALLNRASDFSGQGKRSKSFEAMEQALVIAETEKIVDLQAEILIGLTLISHNRSGIGDKMHYFQQLQSLQNSITKAPVLVMFHRARGAYMEEIRDLQEAESAYQTAIALASLPANAESCDEQLCVVRTEYVHLLCSANRTNEAEEHLKLAEAYAKAIPEKVNGEVFQAALGAGLHWAAIKGDENAAIERIHDLEASATTGYLALNIGWQLINAANNLSHNKLNRAALVSSEAALRLAEKISADTQKNFLPAVLYTIAMVNFHAGRLEDALQKANSLVNITETPETAPIRFAAAQLVSVISSQIGDLPMAVEKAELALGLAQDVDSSFMAKMNLGQALADSGQTERALKLVYEAHQLVDGRANVPMDVKVEIWGHIADYSSQLGDNDSLQQAMSNLAESPTDNEKVSTNKQNFAERIKANVEIRKRIIDISLKGQETNILKESLERVKDFSRFLGDSKKKRSSGKDTILTLHQANALTIAPVIRWWEDNAADDYNSVALDYDYWGRGCFAQILQNLQSFPHSLNITLEVRTLQDIRQAVRLWALYADFILLLWKGPTQSGKFLHLVDCEYFGPWGSGYLVMPIKEKLKSKTGRLRFPAMGYASWLPEDVAKFLVTEAKSFLASGRLLVVPASGVGCVSPGHGIMEQLLTEVANCVPAIRHDQRSDLEIGLLPYALDVPLDILFDFVSETSVDLKHMRQLLLNKTAYTRANGLQQSPKVLELEIADTLNRLRSKNAVLVSKRNLLAAEQEALMSITPFRIGGHGLFSADDSIFSPLLTLESMGYGWQIGASAQSRPKYRYEPAEKEAVGAWLVPPKCGMNIALIQSKEKTEN
jgi:tetratricopeptide (TPR) repeat protein